MKKLLAAFAVLFSLFCAPQAEAAFGNPPQTYIAVSTFTPGAALAKVWAFQNTSADIDVHIKRIEVSNASTGTYTGGFMQYWVYVATAITHGGTSQVSSYSYKNINTTAPSYISVSTGPVAVTYENKDTRQLPIFRPLIVNNDETATTQFKDEWIPEETADTAPLVLLHGSNRGIVFEQRRLGTADITAGTVMIRVIYTVK